METHAGVSNGALETRPVPRARDNETATVTEGLGRHAALSAQKKEALVAVGKKYDVDKLRWQEIKIEQEQAAERQRTADSQKASAPPAQARGKSATGTPVTTR